MLIFPPNLTRAAAIYLLVNTSNGRIYVGSASNLYGRMRGHESAFKARCQSLALQADWDRGHNFYVVIASREPGARALRIKEAIWIARLRQEGHALYNVAPPIMDWNKKKAYRSHQALDSTHLKYACRISTTDDQFLATVEIMNNLLHGLARDEWASTLRLYYPVSLFDLLNGSK